MHYLILLVVLVLAVVHWQWTLAIGGVLIALLIFAIWDAFKKPLEMPEERTSRASARDDQTLKIRIKINGVELSEDTSSRQQRKPVSSPSRFNPGMASTTPSSQIPTRGLVIMEEPLNKILQGRKTMELRSKPNRQLGPVALIKKGSGKIYAVAEIVESVGPMSFDELRAHAREHAVEPEKMREVFEKGWKHGWRLKNVVPLKSPVSYVHKGMSQVNLDSVAIEVLRRQLAGV